jgi:predicted GNAT family N-acyltransferase
MTDPRAQLATPADWPELAELRRRVFVQEQGVPAELERDAADATAVHALSRDDAGRVVATGRLVLDAAGPGRAGIGRMAADARARGRGHGAAVLAVLHETAAALGQNAVELHAQVTARRFYERAGYAAVGAEYQEAGITHVTMVRELVGEDPARKTVGARERGVTDRSASPETRPVRPPE